ncbi:MAG: NUDIX hydrolase [Thermodesulfobacteriota bacterium]
MKTGDQTTEAIKALLTNREPRSIAAGDIPFKEASVLVPLFLNEKQLWLLFTKRAATVEHHKGEISFPGGRVDLADSTWEDTAVRETFEEIGVKEEEIEILGQLDDMTTLTTQFIIHPFVGMIPYPYSFQVNTREVEQLIEIPLRFFFDRCQPKTHSIKYKSERLEVPAFIYRDAVIWGATERILEHFIDLLRSNVKL